jgi:hypothetical protein
LPSILDSGEHNLHVRFTLASDIDAKHRDRAEAGQIRKDGALESAYEPLCHLYLGKDTRCDAGENDDDYSKQARDVDAVEIVDLELFRHQHPT